MPTPSDINTGTITLTNGFAAFTGVGTGWLADDIREGDCIIYIAGGESFAPPIINTITTNTAGTLIAPWTGPTLTAVAYRIRYQWDSARFTAQSRLLYQKLGSGNIEAEAGLTGAADKISYYTGPGAKALADFKAWARSMFSLTVAADKFVYFTSASVAALADITAGARSLLALNVTAAGRALMDDADAAAQLTTLGVSTFIKTLLDDTNAATARATLGEVWEPIVSGSLAGLGGMGNITLPTGYSRFKLIFTDANWNTATEIYARMGLNTSTMYFGAADYTNHYFTIAANVIPAVETDSSVGYVAPAGSTLSSSNQRLDCVIDIFPGSGSTYARAAFDSSYKNSTGTWRYHRCDTRLNIIGRIGAFVIFTSGATTFISGNYALLGIR